MSYIKVIKITDHKRIVKRKRVLKEIVEQNPRGIKENLWKGKKV